MIRTFLLLAAALILASAHLADSSNAGQRLTAREIMSLFPGTFEAVYEEDLNITIEANVDGTMTGSFGYLSDAGRWGLDGDQICIRWDNWLSGRMKCRYVEFVNGWYLAVKDNGNWKLRLRPL